ncbi:DMT family transporter [Massilia endophytica]|uniref:DMT family transporter n=1 Tax=Massilia endophytica TaxID=2899220 RepID=UPI001E35C591|nr:DMT family transporter [Massilia endophytica]UGQ49111.1 DMT family transporter [Massilia endophytica]
MDTLWILLTLAAGALLPLQAAANAQLSKASGSPFTATAMQLAVATALLLVAAACTGQLHALARLGEAPWWHASAGVASALYVMAGIALFPRLGAVTTIGLFICGQMLASVTLDASGLLPGAAHGLSGATLGGTAVLLAGVAMIVRGQKSPSSGKGVSPTWLLVAVAAGAVLPAQGAVNALLLRDLGAPLPVGAVSFAVATASMLLVLAGQCATGRKPFAGLGGLAQMPWWGWVGGLAGAFYVTTVFTALPRLGAAAAVGLTIAGQQLCSIAVDHYGLLRLPRQPARAARLGGVAFLMAGVGCIKFLAA